MPCAGPPRPAEPPSAVSKPVGRLRKPSHTHGGVRPGGSHSSSRPSRGAASPQRGCEPSSTPRSAAAPTRSPPPERCSARPRPRWSRAEAYCSSAHPTG
eukprot:6243826-Prymnesium_polylepis.1